MLIFSVIFTVDVRVRRQAFRHCYRPKKHIFNGSKVILRGTGGGVDIRDISSYTFCTYSYMYKVIIFHKKKWKSSTYIILQ